MCCCDYSYLESVRTEILSASKKHQSLYIGLKRLNDDFGFIGEHTVLTAAIYDKRGKLIGTGKNSYVKTHPIQKKFGVNNHKIFLHAEIQALVNSLRREKSLRGTTLVIFRLNKQGKDAASFCCDGCINALTYYGIKTIVFYDSSIGISSHNL